MQTTLKDIAAKSGFSVTTVSRALAGYNDVNEKTRAHILSIASDLGYQPNLVARQLQGKRTHTLGIVTPLGMRNHDDDFFSLLVKGLGYAAASHQYDLLISAQVDGSSEMDAYRRIVGGRRVDGMILARTIVDDPRIEYLQSIKHPFVVSGRAAADAPSDFPYIDVDSQRGIYMLVDHFVSCGHREIGLILPPVSVAYTSYRHAGYRDGLAAHGIPYRSEYVVHGDLRSESGYRMGHHLLATQPQITAIVACNDLMALGAMSAMQERGLNVGVDVAVGGFDDIPAAEHASPALTTIRQPIVEIGQRLIEMLVQIIEHGTATEMQTLLQPELVVRASSCP